jgi:NAD(P)-dependent dehydrogenase (short-subunit alcohol dehydrogenase family)
MRLAYAGWAVYATVRRPEDAEQLRADAPGGRVLPIELDVTDSGQVQRLGDQLPDALDAVAARIERALTAAKPKARYVVGFDAKAQAALATVMPQHVKDAAFGFATGTPSKT